MQTSNWLRPLGLLWIALGVSCSAEGASPGGGADTGGAAATGGAPSTGGTSSGTGGGSTSTGGASTGGASASTGGAATSTGGAGAGTGGASTGTGGDGTGGSAGPGGPTFPGPVRAFPGAEGFGRDAGGGRGGSICHVTTLADSGPGSVRDCVSQPDRTVVFDVGGWITLSSDLSITQDNLTIAGQTAPGTGIGIRGRKVSIGGSDIVIRHLRVRRGILVTTDRNDAMTVSSSAENVILDHVSVAFGTDETLSMPGDEGIGPRNLTLQWSIVAWGLQRNNHSAGSLLTSNQTTVHHCLWAFNKTRNPRARSELASTRGQGGHLDWVNNVIYGWNAPDPVGEAEGWSLSHHAFILAGTGNGEHAANAVGNTFIGRRSASYTFVDGTSNFRLFASGNVLDGNANGVLDASKTGTDMIEGSPTLLAAPLPGAEVTTQEAAEAYDLVLARAGATAPARDQADALLVSQVQSQDGILIQSERDLIGLGVGADGYGGFVEATRPADFDADRDGMADDWEEAHGLDPSDPTDAGEDANGDGYTNLEAYLAVLAG